MWLFKLSQKDLRLIASSVVLAAVSVLPYDHTCDASHMELEHAKETSLGSILNENKPETFEIHPCSLNWTFTYHLSTGKTFCLEIDTAGVKRLPNK
ncbi:eukaryotic translation initiation factor 3 subunit A-like [Senna tora]|uniref:Eukaryotic translation initiation factor 3 subunit A-like n=1 Tax=Senna tora TaxID=362788 RepID=A0A834W4E1_9FABA|nr:eukaryotic translation initiation factor 3 subunit A-like [Senna tora]